MKKSDKNEVRLRFWNAMEEANIKDVPQLALKILQSQTGQIDIPKGAIHKCALKIHNFLQGSVSPITKDGQFDLLVLDIADFLNTTPETIFKEFLPNLKLTPVDNDPQQVTGLDIDRPLIIRDLTEGFSRILNQDELEMFRLKYMEGMSDEEIIAKYTYKRSTVAKMIKSAERRVKAFTESGSILEGYSSSDIKEYYHGYDTRRKTVPLPQSWAGEFYRAAYRASFQPDNLCVQRDLLTAQKAFASNHLRVGENGYHHLRLGLVSPYETGYWYTGLTSSEMVDALKAFALMERGFDDRLLCAWNNTSLLKGENFISDLRIDAFNAVTETLGKLTDLDANISVDQGYIKNKHEALKRTCREIQKRLANEIGISLPRLG